jgi:hypothetical protein
MSLARPSWIFLSLLLVAAPAAHAIPRAPGAVDLPAKLVPTTDASLQISLTEGRPWREFQTLYGDWHVLWNEATHSPHLAFGPAISLEGYGDDAAMVDRAVRRFVGRHEGLFGRPALETLSVQRARGVWYAIYRQTVGGAPVLFEDWVFCVSQGGRLMSLRTDAHRIPPGTAARATLNHAAAAQAARAGLAFDPARDRATAAEAISILPYPGAAGIEYRPVYQVQVETSEPRAYWRTLVDASTGEVLWRHDELHEAVSGHVTGGVHRFLPTDPLSERPFAHEYVVVGGTQVTTDATGAYSAPASGTTTVTSTLSGPFVRVTIGGRIPSEDVTFSLAGVADGSTVDIHWGREGTPDATASQDDERDAFYHINLAHGFLRTLDPNFTGLDIQATAQVDAGGSCGAFTFGTQMVFLSEGDCPATGTMPDVLYHEYGHVANDQLYLQLSGSPMTSSPLHEATADLLAALLRDDPIIGNGLFGPGTVFRTLEGDARWPEHRSLDEHTTGLILAQAVWDLRRSAGLSLATELYHFARYGLPDDPQDAGLAFSEYFIQALVADDDDGNLGNGTPHLAQINAAFDAHGIGSGYFLSIAHTPLADQSGSGPFQVTATIRYEGPAGFSRLDVNSPRLFYSINGGPLLSTNMSPMGSPDRYRASIPKAPASVVRYYVQAGDVLGGTKREPAGSPALAHLFLTGTQSTVFLHDMEQGQGWTAGAADDDATSGRWVRVEPVGNYYFTGEPVQPELDHTPNPGKLCWVTGNGSPDYGSNNVDGGKTTLFSPVFSAASLVNPVIEYYRWFMNAGRNLDELWHVDLSNDAGAHWTPVETTNLSSPSWQGRAFAIASVLPPTSQMQLRFVAEDVVSIEAVLEAGLDDVRLLSLSSGGAAAQSARLETAGAPALELRAPSPNPFRGLTRLNYAIPRAAQVELGIYDVGGRMVRRLEGAPKEAGVHEAAWDGLDESRRPAASGVYYARLTFEGSVLVRRLVRLQ